MTQILSFFLFSFVQIVHGSVVSMSRFPHFAGIFTFSLHIHLTRSLSWELVSFCFIRYIVLASSSRPREPKLGNFENRSLLGHLDEEDVIVRMATSFLGARPIPSESELI